MLFPDYVYPGLCVDVERGDITYHIHLIWDPCSNPDDFDCYSLTDIERWKNDEWFFGCLEVSATFSSPFDTFELEGLADLCGIECNFSDDTGQYLDSFIPDLLAEALDSLRDRVNILVKAVNYEGERHE